MALKIADLLRRIEVFGRLPEADLLKVSRVLKERRFGAGQIVFDEGDPGDSLFILAQGRVRSVHVDAFGRERVLAFHGEGEVFGEEAILTGAPRTTMVEAISDVRVLQLRKDDFDVLLSGNMELMMELLRMAADRQREVTERLSQEQSSGKSHGQVSVVYSPRGGAGKTMLATNLAVALASLSPDRVVLVDLDLVFGHAPILLDLNPRTALSSISPAALQSMDNESLRYYLARHDASSVELLAGALRPDEGESVTADHVRVVLDRLRQQFLHVVVDTSVSFGDPTLTAVDMAARVFLVGTPDLSSVRDLRECQRVFFDLLHAPRERFQYVINRTSPYEGLTPAFMAKALDAAIVCEIPYGGEAPSLANLEGQPLVMRSPGSPVSRALIELAEEVDRAARESLALIGR